MSGVMTTSSFAKALWPGVNSWYGKAYNEYSTEWDKLFEKRTTRRAFEEIVGTSGMGLAPVKGEGAPVTYDSSRQGFTTRFTPVTYALGFIVTKEAFDDDLYDVVAPKKAQELAFSMRQTKEIVGANVYNRAFTAGYTGGDGVILCSASHVNVAGGTWSNVPTTAVDLSEAALEQASIDIQSFTNDRGLKIQVLPKSLIIPPTLEFEAMRILKSDGRVGTSNNDMNVIKTLGTIPEVIKNHYLTDTDAWFIRTSAPNGMIYFERRADDFSMDNDWDTENAKFKAIGRYAFGWADPRQIYGSQGA